MKRACREYSPCSPAERPLLYDLAYNVFDIPGECHQLLALAERHGLSRVQRVLDLGCGTGHHAVYLASLGLSVIAVDRDPHMLRHARRLARQTRRGGGAIKFVNGDMRERNFARPVDLGICMGASFNSLITERDAARTFDAIGAVLEPGGVFLLELHDPRTTYGKDLTAHWTVDTATARVHGLFKMVPRAAGHYRWDIAVKAEFAEGRKRSTLLRTQARPWTRRDIERLCRVSGVLQLGGWHRFANFGESPRILAAFRRAQQTAAGERGAVRAAGRR